MRAAIGFLLHDWLRTGAHAGRPHFATIGRNDDPAQGRRAAMRYFYGHALPKIGAWRALVSARPHLPRDARELVLTP